MEALRIISDEHRSLAALLHAIRFMLKEAMAGRLTPDVKLFEAMVHYLDAYAEQRHHPKEDLLFGYLAQRTTEGAAALATLGAQHAAAAERIATLQQALAGFVADPAQLPVFSAAFDHYADFYRGHMMLEEDTVLPLIRQHLTAEDWVAVNAAFVAEQHAKSGKTGHSEDFAGLFSRLVAAAPAPIGLGGGAFVPLP